MQNKQNTFFAAHGGKFCAAAVIAALAFLNACAPKANTIIKNVYSVPAEKEVIQPNACPIAAAAKIPQEDEAVLSARRAKALAILEKMTLEQKTGQLFIVGVGGLNNETSPDAFPVAINKTQTKNLNKYLVGGVLFFGGNITDDKQISAYTAKLQKKSKTPIFISVDEEGGIVSRLGNNPQISVTQFPPMKEIGATGNPQNAFNAGEIIGRDIIKFGFNVDFAPVADVVTNPANTIIAGKGRAFGISPDVACTMVPQFVKGLQAQNVSATLKHFPGHGDTVADTHLGRVYSEADISRLSSVELLPFMAGIHAGADFVMVSHISLPKITGDDTPASMSPKIIEGILTGQLGFKGIVISDDMVMEAITKNYSADDAAVKAVLAGSDMLIVKINFIPAWEGVLAAVKNGTITQDRLNESVLKILELKIKRGIIK